MKVFILPVLLSRLYHPLGTCRMRARYWARFLLKFFSEKSGSCRWVYDSGLGVNPQVTIMTIFDLPIDQRL